VGAPGVSHDTLVTGLVVVSPLLLFAAYWAWLRSVAARRRESSADPATPDIASDSGRLIPSWVVLAALGLFAVAVLFLVDAHVARGLLVAIVPFVIFFGLWMFLSWRVKRPPTITAESPPGRPVVTARSRRMALLPIALVLGISAIVRALIGH
jgi:protein-S-isoprenylcysteine O-methyltransferase Ste14